MALRLRPVLGFCILLLNATDFSVVAKAAAATGAGGFAGVDCPDGFELQENGLCIKPLEEPEPQELPIDLLEAAERGDDVATAQFLAHGSDPEMRNGRGQTPLHLAARHGHDNICELLLSGNARVDAVDNDGQQPLHLTVPNGFFDTFTLLVKHGADPNAPLKGGSTLLHFASFKGSLEAVEFMLDNGCDADSMDRDGAHPLHAAAYAGNKDVVELLVKKSSAGVNAQDGTGTTALHLATQQKKVYIVKALLDLGANPGLADQSGATPVLVATHTNAGAVLAELLQAMKSRHVAKELKRRHGAAQETLLHHAAQNGHVDVVKTLVKQKHIMDMIDASTDPDGSQPGHTALILAARAGHYKVCKTLLQAGANPLIPSASSENLDLLSACRLAESHPDGKVFSISRADDRSRARMPPWPPLWKKLQKLLTQDVVDALENQVDRNALLVGPTDAELDELRSELERAGLSQGGIDVLVQSSHAPALAVVVVGGNVSLNKSSSELLASLLELKGLKLGDKKRLEPLLSMGNKKDPASERGKEEL